MTPEAIRRVEVRGNAAYCPHCGGSVGVAVPDGLTGRQQQIYSFIADAGDRFVTASEIQGAVMPNREIKNVHVQIHRMRAKGIKFETPTGYRTPGYRLEA